MAVLVTGATGTNGLEVVKQTLARGAQVRAFVRDKTAAAAILPSEVELFEGDFARRAAARAAMRGVERVFLLAAVHEHMENFERGFIEEARDARIPHLVKFSAVTDTVEGWASGGRRPSRHSSAARRRFHRLARSIRVPRDSSSLTGARAP